MRINAEGMLRGRLRQWLREPLVHFIAAGFVLFLVSEMRPPDEEVSRIVITPQREARLANRFAMQFGAPPDPATLAQLVERDVEEEMLFRRGVALGLDRDDEIVRRRIVQKMEFLLNDVNAPAEPSEAELLAFFEYTITDVLVQVRLLDRELQQTLLRPEQPQFVIESTAQHTLEAPVFLVHGVQHILAGIDHLLFVLGLLLIVRNRWMLLKAVSAFTVAHSITLAAAMLANVSLAAPLVEALIALSILVLGVEVVRAQRGGTSLTIRYPWAVAFVFGLFHGMGFAGGLAAFGMAEHDLLASLAYFNIGVEVGQLAFIALVLLIGRMFASWRSDVRGALLMRAPAYVVGIAGAFWTFETTAVLLGVA